jgi:XTP/dITP diphosphohydrolase
MLSGHYLLKNLHDLNLIEEIPETGETLEENSRIKAQFLFKSFGVDCFADDTGLEVKALNGAPGVRSARYAGEPKDDSKNVELLLKKLNGESVRKARFRTVITLILKGQEYQFEGIVSGTIIVERSGSGGFGYDPVFVPSGHDRTFAEMSSEEKNLISHRGIAVSKLVDFLEKVSIKNDN